MQLNCYIAPEYFDLLGDQKEIDFRQIEHIKFQNNVTGDIRVFHVSDIQQLPEYKENIIRQRYPNIPWDPDLPIFAIVLGTEIKQFVPRDLPAVSPELDKVWSGTKDDTKYPCWSESI